MATLNLHNPAHLYSGGAVGFDATPYVKMALDQRQKRQAREDSIDKYYQQLPNTINDKGVRDQEIPILNQYRDAIFSYGMKNKEALRNPKIDNGKAQFEFNKLMGEAKNVARLSQDAAKEDLEIGKLWLSKDNRWVVDDDEFIAANQRHNLPVTHPDFKKVDIPLILQGKPFDEPTFAKDVRSRFKYTYDTPKIQDHPTDKMSQIEIPNPIISEDEKRKIYSFAAETFNRSGKFRKEIETNLAKSPETLQALKEISIKTFGHPIESDEDIAAAYTVSKLATPEIKPKTVQNKDAVMDRQEGFRKAEWDRRNAITFQQSMEKIRANKAAGTVPDNVGYVSDEVVSEYGIPLQSGKTFVDITNVDPERLDIITNRDISKKKLGVKPVEIRMKQPDGSLKSIKGYYVDAATGDWEGAGGQKISREAVKDRYVQSKAGTKFKAQSGTKGSENTKQKPKKDPLGLF